MKQLFVLLFIISSMALWGHEPASESNKKLIKENSRIESSDMFKNNIKVNLYYCILTGINMSYERRLHKFLTAQVEGIYFYRYFGYMQAFNANLQLRFYPLGGWISAPKFLYIGLLGGYGVSFGKETPGMVYQDGGYIQPEPLYKVYQSPEVGVSCGYQFIFKSGLTLDLGLGWLAFPAMRRGDTGDDLRNKPYTTLNLNTSIGFNF